jgi:hypothetical protein
VVVVVVEAVWGCCVEVKEKCKILLCALIEILIRASGG